jgi:acetyl esterase/lipase
MKHLKIIPSQKELPLPACSFKLRRELKKILLPDVNKAITSKPNNNKELQALNKERAAVKIPIVNKLARQLNVTIEEFKSAGVPLFKISPQNLTPKSKKQIFIYFHGGAYIFNSGRSGLAEAILIADSLSIPVISVDYRMPPGSPFPAALDDAVAVYLEILKNYPAESIAAGGTSAGGGLVLSLVHKLKELSVKLPAVLYAGTPWSDLTKTGDSYFINEGIDYVLITSDGLLESAARLYAGGMDLKNPLLSPVYGDFSKFPPVFLVSGTRDLFLSNTVRVNAGLRYANVETDLNIYEGLSHGDFMFFTTTPESRQIFKDLNKFIQKHLQF